MKKKRIIIIGDHDNTKMIQILKQKEIQFDTAETLEEASAKLFKENGENIYNAIILDINFPKREGMPATRSGEEVLNLLEKKNYNIPILINAFILNPPKSKLVVNWMMPWELHKFEEFIKTVIEK